jgi:hypothetical protein
LTNFISLLTGFGGKSGSESRLIIVAVWFSMDVGEPTRTIIGVEFAVDTPTLLVATTVALGP